MRKSRWMGGSVPDAMRCHDHFEDVHCLPSSRPFDPITGIMRHGGRRWSTVADTARRERTDKRVNKGVFVAKMSPCDHSLRGVRSAVWSTTLTLACGRPMRHAPHRTLDHYCW